MDLLTTLLIKTHKFTDAGARPFALKCPRCGTTSKGAMLARASATSSSWRLGSPDAALETARTEAAQAVADETLALIPLVRCPSCQQRLPAAHLRLGLSLLLESLVFGTICALAAGVLIMIGVEEHARAWANSHPWFGFKLFITVGILGWWAVKMVRRPRLADASVRWHAENTPVASLG